jgi:hypothetical protein
MVSPVSGRFAFHADVASLTLCEKIYSAESCTIKIRLYQARMGLPFGETGKTWVHNWKRRRS